MNNSILQHTDPTGAQTLEQFAEARHFNRWLFDTVLPFCKGRVLEAGSGIGNISELLLENDFHLMASDLREEYCQHLEKKFSGHPNFEGVVQLDLTLDPLENFHPSLLDRFDTVIASNVIEHIEDDSLAVRNCSKMLRKGGHAIILVPAYQKIYNEFDRELGHFRRYNTNSLAKLLQSQGLKLVHSQYFNAAGLAGWVLSGSILKKKIIPGGQLKLFEKLVPLIKLLDKVTFQKIGLSVIAVARKS